MRAVVLACVAVAVSAVPAHAARPVLLGQGADPGVAVDASGTAYVAYNGEYADPGQPLMFCAWPRGARGCTPRALIADNASPSAQPALVHAGAPGAVTIVSSRDTLQSLSSVDGGATFGAPAALGSATFFDGAFGPDGRLGLTYRRLGVVDFYERSLAGPADASAHVELNRGWAVRSEVGWAGSRPVVVSGAAGSEGTAVTTWSGQGDVHDPAMWTPPRRLGKSVYYAMASGPRGLFLAQQVGAFRERVVVRKFNGNSFGRSRRVPAGRLGLAGIIGVALAQDATGRMVAVWHSSPRNRLEYSASRTGRRWTPARVLATGVEVPSDLQVALGPDGRGLVVWDENTGDDIHAVPVSVRRLL